MNKSETGELYWGGIRHKSRHNSYDVLPRPFTELTTKLRTFQNISHFEKKNAGALQSEMYRAPLKVFQPADIDFLST